MTASRRGGRRPIIGVMGSGVDAHEELAGPLGRWIANEGFHLLTGGGGGVMAAVSAAFARVAPRAGLVVAVLPSAGDDRRPAPPSGYPNPWVELAIRTHLPLSGTRGTAALSRNHINVLTADVVVALPGGAGTASEVELARRYGRPCVALVGGPDQAGAIPAEIPCVTAVSEVAAYVHRSLNNR